MQERQNFFFGLLRNCLNCDSTAMGTHSCKKKNIPVKIWLPCKRQIAWIKICQVWWRILFSLKERSFLKKSVISRRKNSSPHSKLVHCQGQHEPIVQKIKSTTFRDKSNHKAVSSCSHYGQQPVEKMEPSFHVNSDPWNAQFCILVVQ